MTTPMSIETILDGQWQAIWKKLGGPFLASLALDAFLIFSPVSGEVLSGPEAKVRWFTAGCFLALTIADALALGWLGMWAGLRIRNVPHGAALSVGKVILPPAILAGAFVWNHGLTSADEYLKTNPYWIPSLWLAVGLMTDAVWSLWARQKLRTQFRLAASDRFRRASPSWWRWLGGKAEPLPIIDQSEPGRLGESQRVRQEVIGSRA